MDGTRIESETIVLWNDGEPNALVTTRSATTKRRMERKGYVFEELAAGSGTWRAEVPKRLCIPRALRAKRPPKTGVTELEAVV